MFKRTAVFILFLALCAPRSFAAGPISLDEALELAYQNNPDMGQARNSIEISEARVLSASALPDPEAEIEIGGLKSNDGSRKGEIGSFSVKQPLEPFGTRLLKRSTAMDDVTIAGGELARTWAKVRTQVIDLYSAVLAGEKSAAIAKDNLDVTRQFQSRVELKYQSGNALKSDVLRANIEVGRSENDVLVSEKNLKTLKGRLNLALGQDVGVEMDLSGSLTYEALRANYESALAQAMENRSDLKNSKLLSKKLEKESNIARLSSVFPSISVGVVRTTEEYENDTAVVLEASYPLWDFNQGELKERLAEAKKQQVAADGLEREVGLEVYEAFLESQLADRQVLLQKKTLDEANELLRQVTLRYEEGEVEFLTYLEHIKTIKESRLAYYAALKNYMTRVAELDEAVQSTAFPKEDKSQ